MMAETVPSVPLSPSVDTTITTTTTNNNNNNGIEPDERKLAETALKAADDRLQSLCVSHAATFVAVERRGSLLSSSLQKLVSTLDDSVVSVSTSKRCLESAAAADGSTEGEEKDGDNGGDDDGDDDGEGCGNTLTQLAEKHRLRRRTLLQHSSLLELLELPNLMDACVRGHLYEEALGIAGFANTLERRHLRSATVAASAVVDTDTDTDEKKRSDPHGRRRRSNPVVANVVDEVRKRELDLRRHLLHRLRSDVTMPQCLEVVTALRRLNGVDLDRSSSSTDDGGGGNGGAGGAARAVDLEKVHEAMERRLQVDFLEARDVWLDGNDRSATTANGTVDPVTTGKPYGKTGVSPPAGRSERLLDDVDVYRTRCFEITTQFLAIFRTSSSNHTAHARSAPDHALQLLSMWTTRRVRHFTTTTLSPRRLASVSTATTLRDALDSAVFFATSMGRVGADFSPLLPGVFEPRIVGIVTGYWVAGTKALEETLRVCRDAGIASPLYSTSGTVAVGGGGGGDGDGTGTDETRPRRQSETPSPPRRLLSLPPLARLVNAFLAGLNELRRCLLPGTFPKLRAFFEGEFVAAATDVLAQNERVVLAPGFLNRKGEEGGKLRTFGVELRETFEGCVEPYLNTALEVAFGVFGVEEAVVVSEEKVDDDEEEEGDDDDEEEEEDEEQDSKGEEHKDNEADRVSNDRDGDKHADEEKDGTENVVTDTENQETDNKDETEVTINEELLEANEVGEEKEDVPKDAE